jgi:hypothetical protein
MDNMEPKEIVEKYLEAWQKGDAKALRALLADAGRYGRQQVSADQVTQDIIGHPAWKNIKMISAAYGPADAAIMYEGDDPKTGQRLRSAEFIKVTGGKIEKLDGMIVGGATVGAAPAAESMAFAMSDAI